MKRRGKRLSREKEAALQRDLRAIHDAIVPIDYGLVEKVLRCRVTTENRKLAEDINALCEKLDKYGGDPARVIHEGVTYHFPRKR